MKNLILSIILSFSLSLIFAQPSYDYYKNPAKVGSTDSLAFEYFKKAYYDHVFSWTKTGADSAFYYLNKAIERDQEYGAAYALLGHIYQFLTYGNMSLDFYEGQEKYAHLSMKYAPKLGDSYTLMADLLWDQGKRDSAMMLLRKAVELEPDHAGNHIWLGIRLSMLPDRKEEAKKSFNYILNKIDSLYGQAYMKMGYLYKNQFKQLDSAKLYFQHANELIDKLPNKDARIYLAKAGIADIERANGNIKEAIRLQREFIEAIKGRDLFFEFEIKSSYLELIQMDSLNKEAYQREYLLYVESQPAARFDDILRNGWDYYKLTDPQVTRNKLWPLIDILGDSLLLNKNQIPDRYIGTLFLTTQAAKQTMDYTKAIQLITDFPQVKALPPYQQYCLALLYALNGDKELAIDQLQECKLLGMEDFDALLSEPEFSNLKEEERFLNLLDK